MTNVISSDRGADKHYKQSGFSSTVTDSYVSPGGKCRGITWDGTNVISADSSEVKHYKHSGFSLTITDSYTSPGAAPTGITWDEVNVISADDGAVKHYKHSGFSLTITDSYVSPGVGPQGITWDGTNVISADYDADKHFKHTGFSATITDSYLAPDTYSTGITWDDANVISADEDIDKHYKHSGFSLTITDSYTSPGVKPQGITWDGRYGSIPKASSDTGVGTDVCSGISTSVTISDTGTGAEQISIQRSALLSDSVDSSENALLVGHYQITDSGTVSSAVQTVKEVIGTDNGQLTETLGLSGNLLAVDESVGSLEINLSVEIITLDESTYLEGISATSTVLVSDNMQSSGSLEVSTTLLFTDSGLFTELTLVDKELAVNDICTSTGLSVVQGSFTVLDTIGSSEDTLIELQLQTLESGSGSDITELAADIVATDNITSSVENALLSAQLQTLDSGSGSDITELASNVGITDSITGSVEIPNIGFSVLDSGNLIDSIGIESNILWSDTCSASDFSETIRDVEWLSGYTYRVKCTINATTAGSQINYQLKLIVGESSGASGTDVHCNANCEDFPNDVRFTQKDGETKHNYWIDFSSLEGVTPNRKVSVWVKVASIPATGTVDFYTYYGKAADVGESEGSDTFLNFDEFKRTETSGVYFEDFLDTYNEESSSNISYSVHKPTKYASNPVFSGGTWDEDKYFVHVEYIDLKYKMWYGAVDASANLHCCYAESVDGYSWSRPTLGLIDYGGNTNNNILLPEGIYGPAIYYDPGASNPDRKYILQGQGERGAPSGSDQHIYFSPDGKNFTFGKVIYGPNPESNGHMEADGINRLEDGTGRWISYYQRYDSRTALRALGAHISETSDPMSDWTNFGVLIPETDVNDQLYSNGVTYKDGRYYGFIIRYNKSTENTELSLWVSRNGLTWLEVDPLWIPRGGSGDWDECMLFDGETLQKVGDKWWFYYTGSKYNHAHSLPRQSHVGIAKIDYRRIGSIHEEVVCYEDFTTFTEVDVAADRIQRSANHIDHESYRNETTYLYKDYGAAHFGDFTHKVKAKLVAGGDTYSINIFFGLANTLNNAYAIETGNHTQIILYLTEAAGSVLRTVIRESYNSAPYYDINNGGFAIGSWVYAKIVKSGTSLNVYLYSDSDYTTLVDTLTLTLHADHEFRYLYACNTWNTGATYAAHSDIENFDLGLGGPGEGTYTSKNFFTLNSLKINADASGGGTLKLELLDVSGTPITGYTKADFDTITTDGYEFVPAWGGETELPSQPVKLKFYLESAYLYSYLADCTNITVNDTIDNLGGDWIENPDNSQISNDLLSITDGGENNEWYNRKVRQIQKKDDIDCVVEARIKTNVTDSYAYLHYGGTGLKQWALAFSPEGQIRYLNSGGYVQCGTYIANEWHKFSILYHTSNLVDYYLDGILKASNQLGYPRTTWRLIQGETGVGTHHTIPCTLNVDWIFARKHVLPEPTWGSCNGEEQQIFCTETGIGIDTLVELSSFCSIADFGQSSEILELSEEVKAIDSATGQSIIPNIGFSVLDTGQSDETINLSITRLTTDTGQIVETIALTAACLIADNAASQTTIPNIRFSVSDTCSSVEFISTETTKAFVDQITSDDVIALTVNTQVSESGSLAEETIELSATCPITDTGQLGDTAELTGKVKFTDSASGQIEIPNIGFSVLDSGNFAESLTMEATVSLLEQSLSEDVVKLSVTRSSTDSGQSSETAGVLLGATVADTGNFTDIATTENNILWEDTCNSNEITQLSTQTIVSDVASSSESVMDLYVIGAFDVSGSSDYVSVQAGSKDVSDYGDGISAVDIEVHTLSEDSGEFSENIWSTCSLEFIDSGSFTEIGFVGIECTISDTCTSVGSSSVQALFSVTDTISSVENVLLGEQPHVSDIGYVSDTAGLTATVNTTDNIESSTEVPDIRFSASDQCISTELLSTQISLLSVDQVVSEDTIDITANIQISESGLSDDGITELTVFCSITDIAQPTETIETSGKAETTDSGSFTDILEIGGSILWTDSGSVLDTIEITSHIGCIDTVDTSENITRVCTVKLTDCSTSEDNTYVLKTVLLTETAEGTSTVSTLVFGTTEDLGQFVDSLTSTGNLTVLDESIGHTVVRWEFGIYHKLDRSIIMSPVSRSINVGSVDRTTNDKFKRRSVRKR